MMKIKSNSSTVTYTISAYTPTLETTVKKPETTRAFYENLSSLMKTFKVREAVIIGGDFNPKTKSKLNNYLTSISGKYAKSDININGEKMIELCILLNLKITNNFFKHKPIHLTTLQSPAPYINHIDSKINT